MNIFQEANVVNIGYRDDVSFGGDDIYNLLQVLILDELSNIISWHNDTYFNEKYRTSNIQLDKNACKVVKQNYQQILKQKWSTISTTVSFKSKSLLSGIKSFYTKKNRKSNRSIGTLEYIFMTSWAISAALALRLRQRFSQFKSVPALASLCRESVGRYPFEVNRLPHCLQRCLTPSCTSPWCLARFLFEVN